MDTAPDRSGPTCGAGCRRWTATTASSTKSTTTSALTLCTTCCPRCQSPASPLPLASHPTRNADVHEPAVGLVPWHGLTWAMGTAEPGRCHAMAVLSCSTSAAVPSSLHPSAAADPALQPGGGDGGGEAGDGPLLSGAPEVVGASAAAPAEAPCPQLLPGPLRGR